MTVGSRAKVALALGTGGTCAVTTPVVLHLTSGERNNILQEQRQDYQSQNSVVAPVSMGSEQLSEISSRNTLASAEPTSVNYQVNNNNEEKEKNFEDLWSKIVQGYKSKQNQNQETTENDLSWENQLKSILLKENLNGEWKIEEQEYKDCSQISGGKTDYCGFLKLMVGGQENRLKFDRYGKGGDNRQWDVTLVRKTGNNVQWYSKNSNKWENLSGKQIDQFKGSSNSQYNHWSTLSHVSIEL